MKIFKCLLCLILFFMLSSAFALKVAINKTRIASNEAFTLTISISPKKPHEILNIAALKKDFNILNVQRFQSYENINGVIYQHFQYVITLMPKKTGVLMIPKIYFADKTSKPIRLYVEKKPVTLLKNQNIFVKVDLKPKTMYLANHAIYTFTLYYDKQVINANMNLPQANNLKIQLIPGTKTDIVRINKKIYHVVKKQFLISAKNTGHFSIASPVFMGQMIPMNNLSQTNFNYDFKAVRLKGKAIPLQIKSNPTMAAMAQWLPTNKLTLRQTWKGFNDKVQVGDPITRKITIKAFDLQAAQLPMFGQEKINGINTYPTKPKNHNLISNDALVGMRTQEITYIPIKSGKITLPKINVRWWNIKKQTFEMASLPGKTIQILPGPLTKQKATPNAAQPQTTTLKKNNTHFIHTNKWSLSYRYILLFITIFCICILLYLYIKTKNVSKINIKAKLKMIKTSALTNDAKSVSQQLLNFMNENTAERKYHNLMQLADDIDDMQLKQAIVELHKHIYAKNTFTWDGKAFWQLLRKNFPLKTYQSKSTKGLPKIFLLEKD